jgi:hypothetical protein
VTVLLAVLTAAVAALAVLVVGLLRSHAEVLRRLHELGAGLYDEATGPPAHAAPRGEPAGTAHDLAGVSPAGEAVAVGIVGAPRPTLLAFLSSGCATCAGFWEAFAGDIMGDLPDRRTRLVVVTRGPEHESRSEVARLAPPGLTTVMSSAAFDDYGVPASPYVVLVDGPSGQVLGEGAAASWPQVANLLRQAVADQAAARRSEEPGTRGRDARVESDLVAAGIGQGHPSLYSDPLRELERGP